MEKRKKQKTLENLKKKKQTLGKNKNRKTFKNHIYNMKMRKTSWRS
jgi:hypothetical protein